MMGVKSDSDSGVDIPDALGVLAEEFIQQYRLGMKPDIDAYCRQHPECASRIRDLFPMLLLVEDCGVSVNSNALESSDSASVSATIESKASLPERIGDFKIIREIGRGGMGIVYEAEQQSLRRRVALKVLPPSATLSPSTIERFRRESRAAARLHHSNIVPVFGVGEDDGLHYYVMQFIQGVGLDQVLVELAESRRSQLLGHNESRAKNSSTVTSKANSSTGSEDRHYWNRVAIIGLQLANALHFAHTQGVLHRDVKPANVLLDSDGLIWLTDFGLAQASDDANLTRSGDIVGTLRYLAPERLHGDGNQLSDVYGLGATLYELLAMVPAFPESDRVTLIRQIAHQEPKRLRAIDPSIPRDLETIVMKAIEKEASRRYRSAAELAEDLSRFLSDRPILARRVVKLEQFWRWCRRNPTVAALSSTVCLLMLGMLIAWSMFSWVQSDRDRARQAEQTANRSQQAAKVAEEFAKARSHLALAIGYRHSREPAHKSMCLAEVKAAMTYNPPTDTKAELRNVAIAAFAQSDVKPGRDWQVWQEDTKCVAYNRPLSRFARLNAQGVVSILSADLNEVARVALASTDIHTLKLSEQGAYLATFSNKDNGYLEIWNVDRSARILGPLAGQWECEFDDQQTKAIVWKQDLALHLYDLQTGTELKTYPLTSLPSSVSLSPDGKQVAFIAEDQPSTVQILDLASAQVVKQLRLEGNIHLCSWHPNGSRLACALVTPSNLEIWDLTSDAKIATMVGHTQPVGLPCFNHDGNYVSTGSWDGTLRIWESGTGQEIATLTDGAIAHAGHQDVVGIRTENGVIATLELDLPIGFSRYATGNSTKASRFAFGDVSPDGRWLVAGTSEGLEIWDLVNGIQTASRPGGNVRMLKVDWNTMRIQSASDGVGIESWQIEPVEDGWRIAEPKLLALGSPNIAFGSVTPDGSRCAIVNENGEACVLTSSGELLRKISAPGLHQIINLSPDGRLLATYGWHAATTYVWDVETGKRLHRLKGFQTFHSFSPDSKIMTTSSKSSYTLRSVDDWKVVRNIERKECVYPSGVAYSPDNSLVAMELSWGVMHLLRADTFETLAVLESPRRGRASNFQFLGNGNTLYEFLPLTGEAHRWNIDEIRQSLRALDLDWEVVDQAPSHSLTNSGSTPIASTPASPAWIDFSHNEPNPKDETELARQNIAAAEQNFSSDPNAPRFANELAWRLLSGPAELQDAERAAALMDGVSKTTALDVNTRNTKAIAYYRIGKYSEAIDLLRENIAIQEDVYLPYDLYFLAMCYWKLGSEGKARETLEWSERMIRLKPPADIESQSELKRFREEAKSLIHD
ncbi:MAG: protein kinase [Pirellulaceae bacterium]|nr:protein kinase [Pirellulaceae bacterium]